MRAEDYEELTYEELREQREVLEELLDSRGWKFFLQILEQRVEGRERELFSQRPENMEQLVRFNRLAGGIDEARVIPEMIAGLYSDADTQVKKIQEEMEDGTEKAD